MKNEQLKLSRSAKPAVARTQFYSLWIADSCGVLQLNNLRSTSTCLIVTSNGQ
jgi:hypothetical protein